MGACGARGFEALFSGARVGVACVNDERAEVETACVLRIQMRAANRDRGGAKPILREYTGRDRSRLGHDKDDIVARPILDFRRGGAKRDARHRQQRFRRRRCVADGHRLNHRVGAHAVG